jgi:PDZ domain-containing protein
MLVPVRLRSPHPLTLFAGAGVIAAALALILVWNPSEIAPKEYVFLPDTAHSLAPVVRVQGAGRTPGGGDLYWVDVFERRATWVDKLVPPDGSTFIQEQRLRTPGETDAEANRENAIDMQNSQQAAEYVALRAAGYVSRGPTGTFVTAVSSLGPAGGKLLPADEILSIDGRAVAKLADVRAFIRAKPAGTSHVFTVVRGVPQRRQSVTVSTVAGTGGRPLVGIYAGTEPRLSLPKALRIAIDPGAVGGPSAGLAFTLQLLQDLGMTVARGYKVAATGTISLDGTVGAIGGIKQKTIGARKAHIDVFLVPVDGDNAKDARRYAGGMRVIPVTTFQQALRTLATLPPKG